MRPLRSVMLGDCDHYLSPYIFGVQQAMARLGHWHSQISIRQPVGVIEQRIADVHPDVLWTHMLLWAPGGAPSTPELLQVVERAARRGARVVIHDGDYKPATRHPHDLSRWCALALCNHRFDRSAWKVPVLHWPYFAFAQDRIADAVPALRCPLFFAGTVGREPVYAARTAFLEELRRAGVRVRIPEGHNTLFRTAEVAASADAVLGFGRPGNSGWLDTRIFQYISAGGILLHDDVGGYFEPWVHYVPYESGSPASVVDALDKLAAMDESKRMEIRRRGFEHGQANHSCVVRVSQVLRELGLS